MERSQVVATLKRYILDKILEGEEIELDPDTPLLELGILNSIEIMALLRFMEQTFGVTVPMTKISPTNFRNLEVMGRMILELRDTTS